VSTVIDLSTGVIVMALPPTLAREKPNTKRRHSGATRKRRARNRKKDMIVSGSFNIFPREMEDVLPQHPDVAMCAATAASDRATLTASR
jgi:hypothetical protein